MSKTALRKQLREMPREELEQVVMELYESRKEVKDYFDFYLDPDVDRLMDRYRKLLLKEASRCSRGYSRCRISAIRRLIKEFSGFDSGREYEMEMMVWARSGMYDTARQCTTGQPG